jgi:squalene-associated FAD-dependent desaturase
VLFGCFRETLTLFGEMGLPGALLVQRALHVPMIGPDGTRRDLRCADLPAPLNLAAGLLRWTAIDMRDRARAARLALALLRGAAPHADESVSAWLARMGQTRRLRGWLWDPLAVAALNEAPDAAAAAPFAAVLRELFTGGRRSSSLVLPRVPLSDLYAEPASAYRTARGGTVHTGRPARLARDGRGFIVRAGEIHWRAPAIVAAVPWHALATLFEGDVPVEMRPIVDAASAMTAVPIVTVNLWLDRPVLDTPFVGLVGRTAQWVFDRRAIAGEASTHLSVTTSAAAGLTERSDGEIIEIIARDVREAIRGAAQARVLRATVIREKQATFSVRPGSPVRPVARTPVPGLFLAGDWLQTGLPGTIEGAVRSGNAAAHQILCDRSSSTTTR